MSGFIPEINNIGISYTVGNRRHLQYKFIKKDLPPPPKKKNIIYLTRLTLIKAFKQKYHFKFHIITQLHKEFSDNGTLPRLNGQVGANRQLPPPLLGAPLYCC